MATIRLCRCTRPAVTGPWCWACAHERPAHILETIAPDDPWDDDEPDTVDCG